MKYKQITHSIRFTNIFDSITEYQINKTTWVRFLPGLYKKQELLFVLKPGESIRMGVLLKK